MASKQVPANSTVLRLLAAGVAPESIAERVAGQVAGEHASAESLRGRLAAALDVLERQRLQPPAEAAFKEGIRGVAAFATLTRIHPRLTPSEAAAEARVEPAPLRPQLEELRSLAIELLSRWVVDGLKLEVSDLSETEAVALQYAEAVVRQQELLDVMHAIREHESPVHAGLSGGDRGRVDDVLLYLGLRGRFQTVDSLLDDWGRLVTGLEARPESFEPEEYETLLTVRDSLDLVLRQLPPDSRADLERVVGGLDERFLAATDERPVPVVGSGPWRPRSWRWYRVPRRLGEHFARRLHRSPADRPTG